MYTWSILWGWESVVGEISSSSFFCSSSIVTWDMFGGSSIHIWIGWTKATAWSTVSMWMLRFLVGSIVTILSSSRVAGTANLPSRLGRRVPSHGWVETQSVAVSLVGSSHCAVHTMCIVMISSWVASINTAALCFTCCWMSVFIVLDSVLCTTRRWMVVWWAVIVVWVWTRRSLSWSTCWSSTTVYLACWRSSMSHRLILFGMMGRAHWSTICIDNLDGSVSERVEHMLWCSTRSTVSRLAATRTTLVLDD